MVFSFSQNSQFLALDTIKSATSGETFGTVAISRNGQVLAIGNGHAQTSNGQFDGKVAVYRADGSLMGQVMEGYNLGHPQDNYAGVAMRYFGRSIALSGDGMVIAVGGIINNSNTGIIKIVAYNEADNYWQWKAELSFPDTSISHLTTYFGSALSLSNDGLRLLVGAYDSRKNNGATGDTIVYQNSVDQYGGHSWSQVGSILASNNIGQVTAVSLSADGQRLTIGRPDDAWRGHAIVYDYDSVSSDWISIFEAKDSTAIDSSDGFGESVSLTSDGEYLAVWSSYDSRLVTYHLVEGNFVKRAEIRVTEETNTPGIVSASSHEGRKLVALATEGQVAVYNDTQDGLVLIASSHAHSPSAFDGSHGWSTQKIALSEDGTTLMAESKVDNLYESHLHNHFISAWTITWTEPATVGDPYILSANGKITKLPDKHGYYRMLENHDTFVNVEVAQRDITRDMTAFLKSHNFDMSQLQGQKLITTGYWNKAIFIESEGHAFSYDLFRES
jgi:hypothetical protein